MQEKNSAEGQEADCQVQNGGKKQWLPVCFVVEKARAFFRFVMGFFSRAVMALCLLPVSFSFYAPQGGVRAHLLDGTLFFGRMLDTPDLAYQRMAAAGGRSAALTAFCLSFALRIKKYGGIIPAFTAPHGIRCNAPLPDAVSTNTGMVSLASVPPLQSLPPDMRRIALHLHLYYTELAEEIATYVQNMPFHYDLFVSVANEAGLYCAQQTFSDLNQCKHVTITIVPNHGRDLAPFFVEFGKHLVNYDIVGHIHAKKSLYTGNEQESWRHYLLEGLLGKERIRSIFQCLNTPGAGIAYPQSFQNIPSMASTWLANAAQGAALLERMGLPCPSGYFDFPVGSMFWARTEALAPLFALNLTLADFPQEAGQNDGTLAHCLERLLGLVPALTGYQQIIFAEDSNPRTQPWGLDRVANDYTSCREAVLQGQYKLVLFDIFDTVLTRPLLHPNDCKSCIAEQITDTRLHEIFTTMRRAAEQEARRAASIQTPTDVDIDAIYVELARLSGLSPAELEPLRRLEIATEKASVSPRPAMVELFHAFRAAGVRVAFASDMFLPRPVIEEMLQHCGIRAWDALYLSCDCGVRKDSGAMYQYILDTEQCAPHEVLMIGDNARSDIQIPQDMGIRTLNVPAAVEMARCYPLLRTLIDTARNSHDIHQSIVLGLIVQKLYAGVDLPAWGTSRLFPHDWHTLGYAFLGPLLTGFSQWLAEKAAQQGITKLYFLARDGKIMRDVYEQWRTHSHKGPASEYLVVSRRAVTVPTLASIEDIRAIAATRFERNDLALFMSERFGIEVCAADRAALRQAGIFPCADDTLEVAPSGDTQQIEGILRYFELRIYAQARQEAEEIRRYLDHYGLIGGQNNAFVDIGYSGSIQKYLNILCGTQSTAFYLITAEKIQQLEAAGSLCPAFLAERQDILHSPYFLGSFLLEKLLSADEGQCIAYHTVDGVPKPLFHTLSAAEEQNKILRSAVHCGVQEYIRQFCAAQETLLPSLRVPVELLRQLYLHTYAEQKENLKICEGFPLDDYYCGRGLQ